MATSWDEEEKPQKAAQNKSIPKDERRRRVYNILGYIFAGLMGIFVLGLFSETFTRFLASLGLTFFINEESGVYADCSKASNRNNPYCRPRENAADKEWKDLKKGSERYSPFTLH